MGRNLSVTNSRSQVRRLLRAGVLCMILAIGCHVWDQYDPRNDQAVTAQIVDCSVVSNVEQPLVRVTIDGKVYLIRPKAGALDVAKCRPGEQIKLYHPPDAPTVLHRDRTALLSVPALMASVLGFILLFICLYVRYVWPIWVTGDWERAPPRIRWLRHVPVQWLSLLLLGLAYPFAMWMRS